MLTSHVDRRFMVDCRLLQCGRWTKDDMEWFKGKRSPRKKYIYMRKRSFTWIRLCEWQWKILKEKIYIGNLLHFIFHEWSAGLKLLLCSRYYKNYSCWNFYTHCTAIVHNTFYLCNTKIAFRFSKFIGIFYRKITYFHFCIHNTLSYDKIMLWSCTKLTLTFG